MAKLNKWQKEMLELGIEADGEVAKRIRKIYQASLKQSKKEINKMLNGDLRSWKLFRASQLQSLENQMLQLIAGDYETILGDITAHLALRQELGWDELFYQATEQLGATLDGLSLNQAYGLATYSEEELAGLLSQNIYNNTNELANRVVSVMERNLVIGISAEKQAKELSSQIMTELGYEYDRAYRKSMQIIRTESTKVASNARLKSLDTAQQMGIETKKMWVSSLDKRTRSTHGHLDGTIIGVDEYFVSQSGDRALGPGQFSRADEVINCRCSIVSVVDGWSPKGRRATTYNADGKKTGTELIKYENYQEWKEKQSWKDL